MKIARASISVTATRYCTAIGKSDSASLSSAIRNFNTLFEYPEARAVICEALGVSTITRADNSRFMTRGKHGHSKYTCLPNLMPDIARFNLIMKHIAVASDPSRTTDERERALAEIDRYYAEAERVIITETRRLSPVGDRIMDFLISNISFSTLSAQDSLTYSLYERIYAAVNGYKPSEQPIGAY